MELSSKQKQARLIIMTFISADNFTNPILKKIAVGDQSVFSDVPESEFNLTEACFICSSTTFSPLSLASNNGHEHIVNILLEMPSILASDQTNFNRALYSAAENGHILIVNKLLSISNIAATAEKRNNYALRLSAKNGHIDIVSRLLEIPSVVEKASVCNNLALVCAAGNGHLHIVNKLLKIELVTDNVIANDNLALRMAAKNGHLNVVNRLLEVPDVTTNIGNDDNFALRWAERMGHNEIAYVLAKAQWPGGAVDMPTDWHHCLPRIYQGALMASGRKEFEGLVKCWIKGKIADNTCEIHHPRHSVCTQKLMRIDKYNAPRTIMQYAGCKDVVNEANAENRADYGMNTLLYSSRLHKTFQTAYENGQKENKERLGYGETAITVYNTNKRFNTGI